jgi:hypothetical protein
LAKRAMSFPEFPVFRKLVPEDRNLYLTLYESVEPYSDFSFNNLLVWLDINNDLEISRLEDCLILRFSNPFEDNRIAYTLIGKNGCLRVIQEVFTYLSTIGEQPRMVMVPECVISDVLTNSNNLPQELVIRANANHRDYIFDIDTVLKLQGKRFSELRHSLNVFNRDYSDKIIVQNLQLQELATKELLLSALERWRADLQFNMNDLRHEEIKALSRYLMYSKWCPAKCLGFFINDHIIGFSIFHLPPQKGWAIGNHIKCDPNIRNAFDFIYYMTMYTLHNEGIQTINGEQDLGIAGLRNHKQQLGPSGFLYRYDISQF